MIPGAALVSSEPETMSDGVLRAEAIRAAVEATLRDNAREALAFRWVALAMFLSTVAAGAAFALAGFGIWLLLVTAVFTMATCVSAMIGFT